MAGRPLEKLVSVTAHRTGGRLSKLGSSPSSITLTKVFVMLLPLVMSPIVARELGPSDRGTYGACIAAVTLIPIVVGLGVPLAVRRRASVESYPEIVRSVYLLVPILVVPAGLLACMVRFFFVPDLSAVDSFALVATVSISTLTVLTLSIQSVLIVRRQYLRIAGLQSVQTVFIAAGTLFGWLFGHLTISWLLWSAAVGAIAAVLVGLLNLRVSPRGARVTVRSVLGEGLSYSGSQISEVAANTVVQILAVSVIGSHESGLFAVAMTIASLPLVLGHTVGIVAFQHVASASKDSSYVFAATAFRSAFVLGVLASVALSVISPLLIPVFFGSAYLDSVPIAIIGCAGSSLLVLNYVSSQLLAAQRRGWAMTAAQLAGLAVTVVVLLILGTTFGGVGAVLSVVVGRIVTLAVSVACMPGPKLLLVVRPADIRPAFRLVLRGKLAS